MYLNKQFYGPTMFGISAVVKMVSVARNAM